MSTFALPRPKPSMTGRAQLDEVAKALVRGGEQREVIALGATVGASVVVDQIGLEAEDRLDPRSPAGLVVIDGAVHHAVVGEAERGHAELRGALGELVDLAGAVEQRILAVDMEVRDGAGHRFHLVSEIRCQLGVILQRAGTVLA